MPLLSPYDEVMQARLTPTMPAMSSGAPEDFVTRARMLREQAIAGAPQGIDPRIAAILARREERLAGQEIAIAEQEARSPWDALARTGAAMASSASPFFGQGIAQGVNAGLDELNQGRAEAVRRRMAVGGARDDLEMQRIEQEGAGRRAAIEQLRQDIALSKDLTESEKAVAEIKLKQLEAQYAPDKYKAEIRAASALGDERLSGVALNRARVGTEQAQQFKYVSEGRAAGAGGGKPSTGFLSPAEVAAAGLDPRTVWQRGNNGLVVAAGKAKSGDVAEVGRLLKEAGEILPSATGSGFGAAYNEAMNFLGASTSGSNATAKLEVIAGALIANMPRMEGPQSDKDVLLYKQAAGDLANPKTPTSRRAAALQTMNDLNSKYTNQDSAAVDAGFRNATPLPAPSQFRVVGRRSQ